MPIRSRHNPRLKDLRQRLLHPTRQDDGWIAVEGLHLVQEAAKSELVIAALFLREDTGDRLEPIAANEIFIVEHDIFNDVCATEAPQGVAALVQRPTASLDTTLRAHHPLLVILDSIQDPGNLGTILRSAEAFGANGVILLPGTVSPWNQKAMRASAGSIFRVPAVSLSVKEMLAHVERHGIAMYAAVARGGNDVAQTALGGSVALLVGNEGAGLSQELLALADGRIEIACVGPVESLNAGVAASILLYAVAQQRGARP